VSHFIVIEGLIGVGKTSLCRIIRDQWKADLILEPADDNPFLASFYDNPDRFAFPAQMFYLASRYAQQARLQQEELFTDLYVADYLFEKDQLFAEQTLSGAELDLYYHFAKLLGKGSVKPDFVLFLDAPTDVILSRINRRAISSEQVIQPEYLDGLRRRYYRLWRKYDRAPVYKLDTTTWNYVDSEIDRDRILKIIRDLLERRAIDPALERVQNNTSAQLDMFENR